jgi:hypothetical protein
VKFIIIINHADKLSILIVIFPNTEAYPNENSTTLPLKAGIVKQLVIIALKITLIMANVDLSLKGTIEIIILEMRIKIHTEFIHKSDCAISTYLFPVNLSLQSNIKNMSVSTGFLNLLYQMCTKGEEIILRHSQYKPYFQTTKPVDYFRKLF